MIRVSEPKKASYQWAELCSHVPFYSYFIQLDSSCFFTCVHQFTLFVEFCSFGKDFRGGSNRKTTFFNFVINYFCHFVLLFYYHFILISEAGAEYGKAQGGKKKPRYLQSCRDVLLSLLTCPASTWLFCFVSMASTHQCTGKLPNHRLLLGRARTEPSLSLMSSRLKRHPKSKLE